MDYSSFLNSKKTAIIDKIVDRIVTLSNNNGDLDKYREVMKSGLSFFKFTFPDIGLDILAEEVLKQKLASHGWNEVMVMRENKKLKVFLYENFLNEKVNVNIEINDDINHSKLGKVSLRNLIHSSLAARISSQSVYDVKKYTFFYALNEKPSEGILEATRGYFINNGWKDVTFEYKEDHLVVKMRRKRL